MPESHLDFGMHKPESLQFYASPQWALSSRLKRIYPEAFVVEDPLLVRTTGKSLS
jgi:hypothetical protein